MRRIFSPASAQPDWFLARISGTIPATTAAQTSDPGTDPSTQYTYTFYEVQYETATGTYTRKYGGRYGGALNPGVSVTGALLAAGSIVQARSAFGAGGTEWELLPITSITPSGTGGTGDSPGGTEDGSVPALTPEGNLAPTQLTVTNYPENGEPATQLNITSLTTNNETGLPEPMSPMQPFVQLAVQNDGDGNGNPVLQVALLNNLDQQLGAITQLVLSGATDAPLSVIQEYSFANPDYPTQAVTGTVTYTPQPGGLIEVVYSANMELYQATAAGTLVPLGGAAGALLAANNLSDLANAATARSNLGLGSAALAGAGAFDAAGSAAAALATAEAYTASYVAAQGFLTSIGGIAAGGDLTGSYPNPTVAANAVTYAKFQQVAADSLVGNPTGTTANAEAIALSYPLAFSSTALGGALTGNSAGLTGTYTLTTSAATVTGCSITLAAGTYIVLGVGSATVAHSDGTYCNVYIQIYNGTSVLGATLLLGAPTDGYVHTGSGAVDTLIVTSGSSTTITLQAYMQTNASTFSYKVMQAATTLLVLRVA